MSLGGDGDDVLLGGPGTDIVNGGDGDDIEIDGLATTRSWLADHARSVDRGLELEHAGKRFVVPGVTASRRTAAPDTTIGLTSDGHDSPAGRQTAGALLRARLLTRARRLAPQHRQLVGGGCPHPETPAATTVYPLGVP